MNGMLKWAMAGVIAFSFGNARAQVTGKTVLENLDAVNSSKWRPNEMPFAGNAEMSATTGTFHAGGVAACDGCHVMHNASGGRARSTVSAPWTDAVPAFLLQGSDQSSTCLMCHGDATMAGGSTRPYIITNLGPANSFAQMNFSPGGDFGWLQASGGTGERHGHNVVAADFTMAADSAPVAPGGTFTAGASGISAFACSSCHDPHGRFRMELTAAGATTWKWTGPTVQAGLVDAITKPIYSSGSYGMLPTNNGAVGAYRLLAGVGYSPASNPTGSSPFVNNPPVAVAPADYNRTEAASQVRVAYGSGMSEWCQNCHTNIHLDGYLSGAMGGTGLKHPAGQGAVLKPGQFDVYNTYVSSGVYGSGDLYTSLVPFENAGKVAYNGSGGANADITALRNAANGTDTALIFVANGQSNVMCLSCHRAHASAFDSAVRWNADDTFITNSTVFVDTQGRTAAGLTAAYYGRTAAQMGMYQRSLCNKCHGKD